MYSPEIKQDIERIPFEEREWPIPLIHFLRSSIEGREEEAVMQFILKASEFRKPHRISGKAMIDGMIQVAHMLKGLGITHNSSIAMILPNIPELPMVLWGGSLICPVIVMDPMMPEEQMISILSQENPELLVTVGPYPGLDLWDRMEIVREAVSSCRIILQVDLVKYLGRIQKWQARRILRSRGKAEPISGQKIGDFNASRANYPSDHSSALLAVNPDQLAIKTTENGHLLEYTHRQVGATFEWIRQVMPSQNSQGRYIWGESPSTLFAYLSDCLLPLIEGQQIVCLGPRGIHGDLDAELFREICAHVGATRMRIGAASMIGLKRVDNDALPKEWIVDPGWIPKWISQETPNRHYYQVTQSIHGQLLGISDDPSRVKNRLLPLLMPYVSVRMEGEKGLLTIKGTFNESEKPIQTGLVIQKEGSDQWQILGTEQTQLTHKGYAFFAEQVEQVLSLHQAVAGAVVVGRTDGEVGEIPVAYIQLRPSHTTGPKEIYEYALESLSEERMVPKGIRIVDVLPRTSVGNFDRIKLHYQENKD